MPALMYHDIVAAGAEDASGFGGRDAALYKVTPERFAGHLDAISRAGAHDTVLTFDDGGLSAMRAADALERHGLAGHFFMTVDYIGAPGFLTRGDLRQLHARGHVVGSHSCSHPLRMGHCARGRLSHEWKQSRAVLSDLIGAEILAASVPGGDFTWPVAETAAEAGFSTLFTSEPTRAAHALGGLTVRGRFAIKRWTRASTAARLASGDAFACAHQVLSWNAKKLIKRFGGAGYVELRRRLLGGSLH
jgi:peptidoglycan/xylan/chitin deacetylase (PgdA/CDA1 family)